MKMITLKLMKLRFKEFIEFKWDLINIIILDPSYALSVIFFWKILIKSLSAVINFSILDIYLFFIFGNIAMIFVAFFFGLKDKFRLLIKSGSLTSYLVIPYNFIKYSLFSSYRVPLGPILQTFIFLSLYIIEGGKLNLNILTGFFLSILFGFVLGLLVVINALLEGIFESRIPLISFLYDLTDYFPTHIYKGIYFVLANIILPGFALGTFQILLVKYGFNEIVRIFTFYLSIQTLVLILLVKLIYEKLKRKWEAYGA